MENNKETVLEILKVIPKDAIYKSFKDGVYTFDVSEGMFRWQMAYLRRTGRVDAAGDAWKEKAGAKYSKKLPNFDVKMHNSGLITFMQK